MGKNLELKIKVDSFSDFENIAKMIGAERTAVLNQKDVYYLKTLDYFKEIVDETSNQEGMLILEELREIINKNEKFSKILYAWKEIDYELRLIKRDSNLPKPNYIILTEEYLNNPKNRNKTHHILQIAQNLEIKTKIVKLESEAGTVVEQFGGLVCYFREK